MHPYWKRIKSMKNIFICTRPAFAFFCSKSFKVEGIIRKNRTVQVIALFLFDKCAGPTHISRPIVPSLCRNRVQRLVVLLFRPEHKKNRKINEFMELQDRIEDLIVVVYIGVKNQLSLKMLLRTSFRYFSMCEASLLPNARNAQELDACIHERDKMREQEGKAPSHCEFPTVIIESTDPGKDKHCVADSDTTRTYTICVYRVLGGRPRDLQVKNRYKRKRSCQCRQKRGKSSSISTS